MARGAERIWEGQKGTNNESQVELRAKIQTNIGHREMLQIHYAQTLRRGRYECEMMPEKLRK